MERTQWWVALSPLPPEFKVGILGPGGFLFWDERANIEFGGKGEPERKKLRNCTKPNRKSTLIIYSMYGEDVLVQWMPKAPPVRDDHVNAQPRKKSIQPEHPIIEFRG